MNAFGLSVAALSLAFTLVGCGGASVPEGLLVPPAPSLAVEAEGKVITLRAEFGEETNIEGVTAYGFYFGQDVSALEKIPVPGLDGTGYSLRMEGEYSSTYVAKAWITNGRDEVVSEEVSVTTVDAPVDPGLDYDNSILFADPAVEALCVAEWDLDGNGKLTVEEAGKVTDLGLVFRDNDEITSFDELKYFTSLNTICDNAFEGCERLLSVNIPESVTLIGVYAFRDCSELTSVSLPEGLQTVSGGAFLACSNLDLDRLPEGLKMIDGSGFGSCGKLSLTSLPESVEYLGPSAFAGDINLRLTSIPSRLTILTNGVFDSCEKCRLEELPANLVAINNGALRYNRALTKVTIPAGVKEIGENAFEGCTSLYTVKVLAPEPPAAKNSCIGDHARAIYVPASSLDAYLTSPSWSSWKDRIKSTASE